MSLNNKTYLVVSLWCYPFGGGEEYMHQTMEWTSSQGMKNYWISFTDSTNKPHQYLKINKCKNYTSINVPGGLTTDILIDWIKLIKPDIVHHQGHHHKDFYNACHKLRTEFISGIHFWTGIIKLSETTYNVNILENYNNHEIDPVFDELYHSQYCTFYSVSDFVTECVKKICDVDIEHTIYSGSSEASYYLKDNNIITNRYVTVINIHKLKGGELVLELMKRLPNIPFLVISTEHLSGELDEKIKNYILERNTIAKLPSLYLNRTDNPKYIYSKTKILLTPSLVDETFCRTAHEAMMNGIPIITSGRGNLKYLINDNQYIIDPSDTDKWAQLINELYNNENKLLEASEYFKNRYRLFSEKQCKTSFINLLQDKFKKSKENNIMIYCPWCDQGLGIQSRNYYDILNGNNFNVFVFSYRPYNADSTVKLQKNKEEWAIPNVYYSSNDREHVTDMELIMFIEKYNIGKCIIPETCWNRVFEIAKLMEKNNVKCYAIPNLEIIRKDELFKHTYFYKILCNNHACEKLLNQYGITNTEYVGYGITNKQINIESNASDSSTIQFLFIGGMNAFSRKQILEICEAFTIASRTVSNIKLTCTIQKTNELETDDIHKLNLYKNDYINIVQDHLTYDNILNLYGNHHISIQVSKHEGLGLGFYEALITGTPIITLDTPPHNEIILNNINGWIIPCTHKPMTDNNNGLIESAYFNPIILADKIIEIASDPQILQTVTNTLVNDYINRLDITIFTNRFVKALS